ncbi:MAG: response regulator [Nocardioidaceae bacterium]
MTDPVRVVIADDHPMFRDGLRAALATTPEVEVVGDAADGTQLVEIVERTTPDVVLTDLAMPGLDGTTATKRILERHPDVKVIMLTVHAGDEFVFRALRAGASGYLLKDAQREDIVLAVRTVAAGGTVYGGAVGRRISDFFTSNRQRYTAEVFPDLTPRERDILQLVALGLGNHEIARRLVLSEKTIRNNLAVVLTKLQVHDRAAAVAKARDAGLGGAPPE